MAEDRQEISRRVTDLLASAKNAEARAEVERLLSLYPGDPEIGSLAGDVYSWTGAPSTAYRQYNAAADAYHRLGESDKMLAVHHKILELDPTLLDAQTQTRIRLLNLLVSAEDALAANRLEEAVGWYKEATKQFPNHTITYQRLATLLVRMGQNDDAVQQYMTVARAFFSHHVHAKARPYFERVLELEADHSEALQSLMNCLAAEGKPELAEKPLKAATQLALEKGEPEKAQAYFDRLPDEIREQVTPLKCALLLQSGQEQQATQCLAQVDTDRIEVLDWFRHMGRKAIERADTYLGDIYMKWAGEAPAEIEAPAPRGPQIDAPSESAGTSAQAQPPISPSPPPMGVPAPPPAGWTPPPGAVPAPPPPGWVPPAGVPVPPPGPRGPQLGTPSESAGTSVPAHTPSPLAAPAPPHPPRPAPLAPAPMPVASSPAPAPMPVAAAAPAPVSPAPLSSPSASLRAGYEGQGVAGIPKSPQGDGERSEPGLAGVPEGPAPTPSDDREVLRTMAEMCLAEEMFEEAKQVFERLLRAEPNQPQLLGSLNRSRAGLGLSPLSAFPPVGPAPMGVPAPPPPVIAAKLGVPSAASLPVGARSSAPPDAAPFAPDTERPSIEAPQHPPKPEVDWAPSYAGAVPGPAVVPNVQAEPNEPASPAPRGPLTQETPAFSAGTSGPAQRPPQPVLPLSPPPPPLGMKPLAPPPALAQKSQGQPVFSDSHPDPGVPASPPLEPPSPGGGVHLGGTGKVTRSAYTTSLGELPPSDLEREPALAGAGSGHGVEGKGAVVMSGGQDGNPRIEHTRLVVSLGELPPATPSAVDANDDIIE